jgi:hypothetical protein
LQLGQEAMTAEKGSPHDTHGTLSDERGVDATAAATAKAGARVSE